MDKHLVSQMRELVEKARKEGAILQVSEAFDLYPVEDEIHEGKLEYWTTGEPKSEV